jgi:hypothetical protein
VDPSGAVEYSIVKTIALILSNCLKNPMLSKAKEMKVLFVRKEISIFDGV